MRLGKYLEADDSACSPPSVPLNQGGMSFVTPAPGPSDLEIILDFGDLTGGETRRAPVVSDWRPSI